MYSDTLRQRFLSPAFAGDVDEPDGFGKEGNITCGDVVAIEIKVTDGVIAGARFRAQGCATAIAVADAVCQLVEGGSITAASVLDVQRVSAVLDGIPPTRLGCATIVLDALRHAIDDARDDGQAAGSR